MRPRLKEWHIYVMIAVCHIILCMPAFLYFRQHPMSTMFCGYGDGIKNIFTMLSYVREPIGADGLFKYNAFAYPFGDYVYYTDNTPLFSVPFKLFCKYVVDVSAYTQPLYYVFVIQNIIVCGLLVYRVFGELIKNRLFAVLMAIALPWTTMQVQRITRGHFSLSFSSLVLLAILLLIYWHRCNGQRKKQAIVLGLMCLLSYAGFMVHGYFFAIITVFIAFGLMFYGIATWRSHKGWMSIVAAGIYTMAATAISLLSVYATDKYLPLRKGGATGYDWIEQKVRAGALVSHYAFQQYIYFPLPVYEASNDAETAAYLGNVGLYLLAILLIATMISKHARALTINMQRDFFGNALLKTLFLSGLVLLSISMGEVYYTQKNPEDGYKIVNLLNPFFYAHFFTKAVEHFRCLERFIYPFYFTFYLWVAFMLARIYEMGNRKARAIIIVLFVVLAGAEIKDNVDRLQMGTDIPDPLCKERLDSMPFPAINTGRYQAILPIPYYCVGSEEFDYTVNANGQWREYTMQMQLRTGLPLMSFEISRTPPAYSKALLELVAGTAADAGMMAKFNNKPVLVAVHKKMAADTTATGLPANEHAAALFKKSLRFAERNQLVAIDSAGDVTFYEWYPRGEML